MEWNITKFMGMTFVAVGFYVEIVARRLAKKSGEIFLLYYCHDVYTFKCFFLLRDKHSRASKKQLSAVLSCSICSRSATIEYT